jgi:DNA-binding NtrC family response regulator
MMQPLLSQERRVSHWSATADLAVRGRTILLIECGTTINQVMRLALQETDHKIIEASSIEAALDTWANLDGVIDLIVADVTVERDEGVRRLLELARNENPRLRVLFISGSQGAPALHDAAYPKQLRAVVENCLCH